jgi:preprotein translocase subunit SecE
VADTKRVKQSSGPVAGIARYVRETRGELRKVTWPTREESWRLTLIVLGVSAVTAIFLGVILDSSFSWAVQRLVEFLIGA